MLPVGNQAASFDDLKDSTIVIRMTTPLQNHAIYEFFHAALFLSAIPITFWISRLDIILFIKIQLALFALYLRTVFDHCNRQKISQRKPLKVYV